MSGGSVRPSCPSGGTWFICLSSPSQFVGCCKTDPCGTAAGCPAIDTTAPSFDPASYGSFPDQVCPAGQGSFYTCTFEGQGKAPFMGCCRSNACVQGGCPAADLGGAALATNSAQSQPFITAVGGLGVVSSATGSTTGTSSQSLSSSIISSSSTLTSTSTQTATSSTRPSSQSRQSGRAGSPTNISDPFSATPGAALPSKMSRGSIAGVTIAGVVLLAALSAIVFFICTRRRRMAQQLQRQPKGPREDDDIARDGEAIYSSGGLFTPQRGVPEMEQQRSPITVPEHAIQAFGAGAVKTRSRMEDEERYGYDEQDSSEYPTGRYYTSPSPNRTSSISSSHTSPAPPYDLQKRFSSPPLFPPHPAMLSLHSNLPQHPYYQTLNGTGSTTTTTIQPGHALPLFLPPTDNTWPATSLATVPEAAHDDEDIRSISQRSSGTVMVAVGTSTGSPKPSMVIAREYTSSVMLAASPAADEEGHWSGPSRLSGPPRRRSMVGEVYDGEKD